MGATAIEDKLQDGVPETIANLAKVSLFSSFPLKPSVQFILIAETCWWPLECVCSHVNILVTYFLWSIAL